MSRRGWAISRDGRALGELYEGPGPFISTVQLAGPHPRLVACAYVSSDEASEAALARLVIGPAIDGVLDAIVRAGFDLEPIEAPETALPLDSPRSPLGDFRG